jgi:hypothetical protein
MFYGMESAVARLEFSSFIVVSIRREANSTAGT